MGRCTMDCLRAGQRGRVCAVEDGGRTRLQDLGLIEGTEVACLLKGPSGSPAAYEIRGAVIALRREDARTVRMELIEP